MTITNRSEILFLYDISYSNPNGDPNDENKPRIDDESSINLVTDVRLKRTIRDYLHDIMGEEILVREIVQEDGTIQDGKKRAEDFLDDSLKKGKPLDMKQNVTENVLNSCIDVRLFGSTLPMEKTSVTLTGAVQFKMGKSLHRVKLQFIKGTGAFASKEGAAQKTFREEYVLPYSLIAFYGVVNENAAVYTNLEEEDVQKMLKAMWNGTRDLLTRSKVGQLPRLLLRVVYKEKQFFHIGDLEKLIKYDAKGIQDEAIRELRQMNLNFDMLAAKLIETQDRIDHIEILQDPNLTYQLGKTLQEAGFVVNQITV